MPGLGLRLEKREVIYRTVLWKRGLRLLLNIFPKKHCILQIRYNSKQYVEFHPLTDFVRDIAPMRLDKIKFEQNKLNSTYVSYRGDIQIFFLCTKFIIKHRRPRIRINGAVHTSSQLKALLQGFAASSRRYSGGNISPLYTQSDHYLVRDPDFSMGNACKCL